MLCRPLLVLVLPLAQPSLCAQDLAWKLPKGAVVEYTRVADQHFGVGRSRGKAPPSARIRDGLKLKSLRNPSLLFAAELDARQQVSTETPTSFWDVIPYIALALDTRETGGKLRYEMPRIMPIGDLRAVGSATAVIDGGVQELRLKLRSGEPQRGAGPRKYFDRLIGRHYGYGFRGELEIRRVLDLDKGLVRSFHARLEGQFIHPKGARRRQSTVLLSEEWTLKRVHGYRDAAFRTAVVKAIKSGAARVRHELQGLRNRRLKPDRKSDKVVTRRSYKNGRLALAVLTLVKAEVDRKDKVLLFGLEELRKRVFYDSYSTGLAIMAMEAYYAPLGERNDLISGVIKRPRQRSLPPRDMKLVEEWTKQLLANQDTRLDRGYRLAFNYTRGRRYDHSVNQYALLGLYSAHLCGVRVPGSVWISAARHLIDEQRDEFHKPLRLQVRRYGDKVVEASASRTVSVGRLVKPRGWAYYGKLSIHQLASGGMTAAGIAGLTICAAALQDMDLRDQRILQEADAALRGGYAWFAAEFSVRANAGYEPRYGVHRFYYLYSMERAFELAGIEFVQGRDWYHEGARMLLAWQNQKNGSWPGYRGQEGSLVQTCFAVLFLKKSALPVLSGRR